MQQTADDQVIRLPFSNDEQELGKNSTNIAISDENTEREENQEPEETDGASVVDDKLSSLPSVYRDMQVQMNTSLAGESYASSKIVTWLENELKFVNLDWARETFFLNVKIQVSGRKQKWLVFL